MTHLTPGAKALHRTFGICDILSERSLAGIEVKPIHGQPFWAVPYDLTPLISATIAEDGKAREPNPLGKEGPLPINEFDWGYVSRREKWEQAEASLRTWEVDENLHTSSAFTNKHVDASDLRPGTPVLGYEKEGKFIIVEVGA